MQTDGVNKMNNQMILPVSNLKKINKLLSEGWIYEYMVGEKHVLLRKYDNTRDSTSRGSELRGLIYPSGGN